VRIGALLSRRKMSYVRPVRQQELVTWLLENGFAEEKPGYGHVDAETLAAALRERFDVIITSAQP